MSYHFCDEMPEGLGEDMKDNIHKQVTEHQRKIGCDCDVHVELVPMFTVLSFGADGPDVTVGGQLAVRHRLSCISMRRN